MAHRDGYTALVSSGVGKKIATTLGLPPPVPLRRHVAGRPLVDGPGLAGGLAATAALAALREGLVAAGATLVAEVPDEARRGAVVGDRTAARTPADLASLRATRAPALRRLRPCARVDVIGRDPARADGVARPGTGHESTGRGALARCPLAGCPSSSPGRARAPTVRWAS